VALSEDPGVTGAPLFLEHANISSRQGATAGNNHFVIFLIPDRLQPTTEV
jgi:hypothetical protein